MQINLFNTLFEYLVVGIVNELFQLSVTVLSILVNCLFNQNIEELSCNRPYYSDFATALVHNYFEN